MQFIYNFVTLPKYSRKLIWFASIHPGKKRLFYETYA